MMLPPRTINYQTKPIALIAKTMKKFNKCKHCFSQYFFDIKPEEIKTYQSTIVDQLFPMLQNIMKEIEKETELNVWLVYHIIELIERIRNRLIELYSSDNHEILILIRDYNAILWKESILLDLERNHPIYVFYKNYILDRYTLDGCTNISTVSLSPPRPPRQIPKENDFLKFYDDVKNITYADRRSVDIGSIILGCSRYFYSKAPSDVEQAFKILYDGIIRLMQGCAYYI